MTRELEATRVTTARRILAKKFSTYDLSWNVQAKEGKIRFCRGLHDKRDDCEWEETTW